jgi:hypothetical protein
MENSRFDSIELQEGDVILITWIDTVGDPETIWKCTGDTTDFFEREDYVAQDVGFYYGSSEDMVGFYSSKMMGEDDSVNLSRNRTMIPKACIKEIEVLKRANEQIFSEDDINQMIQ